MEDVIYDRMYRVEDRHWWFSAKRAIIYRLLERYLLDQTPRRPLRLADLGCGCGRTLQTLPPGMDGYGLDCSPRAIDFCRQRGLEAYPGHLPDDVPFGHESFDAVLLADVLEHIEDDAAASWAAARLLRPGGVMIVTVPALPGLWSSWDAAHGHRRRYTRSALTALLSTTGLESLLVSHCNAALLPAAALVRLAAGAVRAATNVQLALPPAPLNAALRLVFASEKHLLGHLRLPLGLSLVAVMKKPEVIGAAAEVDREYPRAGRRRRLRTFPLQPQPLTL